MEFFSDPTLYCSVRLAKDWTDTILWGLKESYHSRDRYDGK